MFGFHRLSFLIYLFLNWGRICVPGGAYALPTKLLCSDFCYQCEYKAKQKKYLPRYIKSIHGEASHDCDQCKYKAKRKGLLKNTSNLSMGMISIPVSNVNIKLNRRKT